MTMSVDLCHLRRVAMVNCGYNTFCVQLMVKDMYVQLTSATLHLRSMPVMGWSDY